MPQPECTRHLFKGGRSFVLQFYPETTERHHTPHIHAISPDCGRVSISLLTLEVLAPPNVSKKCPLVEILGIVRDNRMALLEELEKLLVRTGNNDNVEL